MIHASSCRRANGGGSWRSLILSIHIHRFWSSTGAIPYISTVSAQPPLATLVSNTNLVFVAAPSDLSTNIQHIRLTHHLYNSPYPHEPEGAILKICKVAKTDYRQSGDYLEHSEPVWETTSR